MSAFARRIWRKLFAGRPSPKTPHQKAWETRRAMRSRWVDEHCRAIRESMK